MIEWQIRSKGMRYDEWMESIVITINGFGVGWSSAMSWRLCCLTLYIILYTYICYITYHIYTIHYTLYIITHLYLYLYHTLILFIHYSSIISCWPSNWPPRLRLNLIGGCLSCPSSALSATVALASTSCRSLSAHLGFCYQSAGSGALISLSISVVLSLEV